MSIALILAAGETRRWGNHLGVPKMLAPFKGVPLVHRTIAQLNDRGIRPTVVVREDADERIVVPGADYCVSRQVRVGWQQEQEGSRHLWAEDVTRIFYGDTYYSEACMDRTTAATGEPWQVFARMAASRHTGKPYGEMFSWSIGAASYPAIDDARDFAIGEYLSGRHFRCLGWEIYRHAVGFSIREHVREREHFVEVDDLTDDIDFPADYEAYRVRGVT